MNLRGVNLARVRSALRSLGFVFQETGGGVRCWIRRERGGLETVVSVDGEPPESLTEPVQAWTLRAGEVVGEPVEYESLAAAVGALRRGGRSCEG